MALSWPLASTREDPLEEEDVPVDESDEFEGLEEVSLEFGAGVVEEGGTGVLSEVPVWQDVRSPKPRNREISPKAGFIFVIWFSVLVTSRLYSGNPFRQPRKGSFGYVSGLKYILLIQKITCFVIIRFESEMEA